MSDGHEACPHCGLSTRAGGFCCYGCELAHELAVESSEEQSGTRSRMTVSLLLGVVVMMLSLFLYAEDVYEATRDAQAAWLRSGYRGLSAVLATPVMGLLGVPLARRAWARLRAGAMSMDLWIVVAATAAYGLSLAALFSGGSRVYFDSAVAALLLATLGRYLEAAARTQASGLVGPLLEAGGKRVMAGPSATSLQLTAPADIAVGDHVRVAPERPLPVDARVVDQEVEVSLAVVTGESVPVRVAPGDEVPAGAVPIAAELHAVALRSAKDSTLEQLGALARSLRQGRARVERVADRFATWLTPVVTAVALAAMWRWTEAAGTARGIEVALSVMLVACPCTYGVLTPLLTWLTLREALAKGVCIRSAGVLERLAAVERVVFDKTGTLTRPLDRVTVHGELSRRDWSLVAALERDARHPMGRALAREAARHATPDEQVVDVRQVAERGVEGRDAEGRRLRLGRAAWASDDATPASIALSIDGRAVAGFDVDEAPRAEAAQAIASLQEAGIASRIASGDRADRVAAIGRSLGIAADGAMSADDKLAVVRAAPNTAVVGDGMNDAPALAAAAVSYAVQDATTLARGAADVVLLDADLERVPWTIGLARRMRRIAWTSLVGATVYNAVFVAIAAAGFLRPVLAGIAMLCASLVVLLATLRIRSAPEAPPTPLEVPA